jgi:hypothetical protein
LLRARILRPEFQRLPRKWLATRLNRFWSYGRRSGRHRKSCEIFLREVAGGAVQGGLQPAGPVGARQGADTVKVAPGSVSSVQVPVLASVVKVTTDGQSPGHEVPTIIGRVRSAKRLDPKPEKSTAKVRFRFVQVGTSSWWFGIDNFGLYSIPSPTLTVAKIADKVTLSWGPTDAVGFTLQSAPTLASPQWATVSGVVNNAVTLTIGANNEFFRLIK